MKNRKILVISTVGLIYDGITSVILSNLMAMDRTGLDIYVAATMKAESEILAQFRTLECSIVRLPDRKKDTKRYFFELFRFIKRNHIEVVHANGNSATLAIEMLAAELGGCKKRIAHSHNTKCDQIRADKILRPLFYATFTDALACGEAAGKWLFGNRKFSILHNGRDVERFKFNSDKRKEMRKLLGIGDALTIGHVGGFVPQKNHSFLLKIYRSLADKVPDIKLYLIGDGPLKSDIMRQSEKLGLQNNIVFAGNVDNVSDYLQAMDGMVFPSFFEGLPLVAIEWQINGLPFVMSDAVTEECLFSNNTERLSLNSSPYEWADDILKMVWSNDREKESASGIIAINEAGYNIKDTAAQLRDIYID